MATKPTKGGKGDGVPSPRAARRGPDVRVDALGDQGTEGREWTLTIPGLVFSHNELTSMNRYERAKAVKAWRLLGAWHAKAVRMPALDRIEVHVTSHFASRRRRRDVAADAPTAKAVIDGFQDAGVLVNDNPDHVRCLVFHRPVFDGSDALEVRIREVST